MSKFKLFSKQTMASLQVIYFILIEWFFFFLISLASLLIRGHCSLLTVTRAGESTRLKAIKTTHFKMPHLFAIQNDRVALTVL